MSTTLAEIRLRSRQKADREGSEFVQDAELDFMINSSVAELHDLLIAHAGADYFLDSYSFNLSPAVENYSLPANFYKLKGIDLKVSGLWQSLRPFNFNERNRVSDDNLTILNLYDLRYRLSGDNLKFSPVPDSQLQCRLWFTPLSPKLVLPTDTLKDLNQYVEYVLVDVAIKYLMKEESDVQGLMVQKADLRKRIENMSANRDEGQPETVSDIYAENSNLWARGR